MLVIRGDDEDPVSAGPPAATEGLLDRPWRLASIAELLCAMGFKFPIFGDAELTAWPFV